jgi:2-polyprenyl-3-methyl-5-hydroxy-6-metoxy-1,4-benzoquinol methylase
VISRALLWTLWRLDTIGTMLAPSVVRWMGQSAHPIHPKHLLNATWQRWYLAHIEPGDVVLDAGCGNAMHTLACASRCYRAIGVDADAGQLRIGLAQARDRLQTNLCLVQGDVDGLWQFEGGCFDKVMLLDVLEHLDRRERTLSEACRVLKPRGLLLVSVPQSTTHWKMLRRKVGLSAYADPDHRVEYTREEILELVSQSGLECQATEPVVVDTWLAGPIDMVGGFSPRLYRRLAEWKRQGALLHPDESTGFRIVARKR